MSHQYSNSGNVIIAIHCGSSKLTSPLMMNQETSSSNQRVGCGVVLVTTSSESEAEAIASTLVEQRLAACVACLPVRSIYRWQGEICKDLEWQLIIKTDLRHFHRLAAKIQALHSYDVPEIIALPIVAGQSAYLDWIVAQVEA